MGEILELLREIQAALRKLTTPGRPPVWGEWLTIRDTAAYTGYSVTSVRRWIDNPRDAPPTYGQGARRRFRRTEVDTYLESQKNNYQETR